MLRGMILHRAHGLLYHDNHSLPQAAKPLPFPLRVGTAGKNHLNEEIPPFSPLG